MKIPTHERREIGDPVANITGTSLPDGDHRAIVIAMLSTILGLNPAALAPDDYLRLIGLLAFAVTLYFAYKVFYHRDFGVPVRRRLFQVHMRVERDQVAFVPFWWSDIQVQRAIRSYWKQALRQGFGSSATASH